MSYVIIISLPITVITNPFLVLYLLITGHWLNTLFVEPKPGAIRSYRAADFLKSIGVNSSISKRGESLDNTTAALQYTGIRWVRTGYEGSILLDDLIHLHHQTGVRFGYGLLSGGTDIGRLINDGRELSRAGASLALERANEPNNWRVTYNGQKGGAQESWLAVAQLQRDLYAAVKSDSVIKTYPV